MRDLWEYFNPKTEAKPAAPVYIPDLDRKDYLSDEDYHKACEADVARQKFLADSHHHSDRITEIVNKIVEAFLNGENQSLFLFHVRTLVALIDLSTTQKMLKAIKHDERTLEDYALRHSNPTTEERNIYRSYFAIIEKPQTWARHEEQLRPAPVEVHQKLPNTKCEPTSQQPIKPLFSPSTVFGFMASLVIVSLLSAIAQHPDAQGLKKELNQAAHAVGRFIFGIDALKVNMDDPTHSHIAVSTLLTFGGAMISIMGGVIGSKIARKPA